MGRNGRRRRTLRKVVLSGALAISGPDADLVEWVRVGEFLRKLEPDRFARLLELGRSYASAYDQELEPRDVFEARLAFVRGGKQRASS